MFVFTSEFRAKAGKKPACTNNNIDLLLFCASNISYTYVNLSLNQYSYIDYVLVSCNKSVIDFAVLEPDVNYSDYLPLHTNNVFVRHP